MNSPILKQLLYNYRSILREYELDINELKTFIAPAAKQVPHFWPKELSDLLRTEFGFGTTQRRLRNNERIFVIDRVFDLANKHNDDGIIKFAFRRLAPYEPGLVIGTRWSPSYCAAL